MTIRVSSAWKGRTKTMAVLVWDMRSNSIISMGFLSSSENGGSLPCFDPTMRALDWPCACVWLPGRWHGLSIYPVDFCGHDAAAGVACKRRRKYTMDFGKSLSLLSSSPRLLPTTAFGLSFWCIREHATAGNQGQARQHGGNKIFGLVRTVLGVAGDDSGSSSGGTSKDMRAAPKDAKLLSASSFSFVLEGRPRIATFR